MKYTFRFLNENEKDFRRILSRLDENEYTIIEDIKLVDEKDPRYSDKTCIIDMDAEAALTFRLGFPKNTPLKIERERTEEEAKAKKEREDRHTIRVNVQTTMGDGS